jgi:type IV pilus assembly protein PilQ
MTGTIPIRRAAPVLLALLALLAGGNAQSKSHATTIKAVALSEEAGATSVSIDTGGKVHFNVTEIQEPHRVFIDVNGAGLGSDFEAPGDRTALVSKAVVEEFDESILGTMTRVTLHVTAPVKIQKSSITKNHLVLLLQPEASSTVEAKGEPPAKAKAEAGVKAPPTAASASAKKEKETKKSWSQSPAAGDPPAATKKVSSGASQADPGDGAGSPAAPAQKSKKAKGMASKLIGSEDPSVYNFESELTASAFVSLPKQVSLAGKKKKDIYTGTRIDLDFKDADIHNILRLLSEVGHVNVVVSDDVKGSVTLKMRNVPWNLALDVILEAKNLGKVKIAENVYRVAPKEELEKERQMKIKELQHKKILKPLITRIIPVSYAMAADLKPQAESLLSSRGSVGIDERTNVLIVRDVAENLSLIEQLVRNLDTQTPQVLIEARIVESTSNYSREIGIQWGGHFTASTATGNPTGIVFPNSIVMAGGGMDDQTPTSGMNPFGATPNPNFAVNLPALVGTGSGGALGISLGSVGNNANLNIRLSALENDGVLKIISAPKILTLDNKQAKIEQGTMIPYSQISAQGVQTAFQEAKLSLQVTPHVTAEGSILMKLMINRDEPDFNNRGARGDPTILKRHAETELLIEDGKTAVIGGIYTRNYGKSFSQVPLLSKIPVLGWLFKKRTDTDRRTELLIFITPRIVNRAESIGK